MGLQGLGAPQRAPGKVEVVSCLPTLEGSVSEGRIACPNARKDRGPTPAGTLSFRHSSLSANSRRPPTQKVPQREA